MAIFFRFKIVAYGEFELVWFKRARDRHTKVKRGGKRTTKNEMKIYGPITL